VSGKNFLKYGGNTSCLEVRTGDPEQTILIDFGTGALPMGQRLARENTKELDVLITHAHWDHIMGFPLFPLLFIPGAVLRFHYNPRYQGNPEKTVLKDMMASPHFPVSIKNIPAEFIFSEVESEFFIGPIYIQSMPLSHPNLGLGYRLKHNNKSLVFLTDNELGHIHRGGKSLEDYAWFCRDADLLIHDAEYYYQHEYDHTRGFGHSLAEHVLDLAGKAGVKSLGLFHHNRERTDDQIEAMVAELNGSYSGKFDFDIFAVAQDQEIIL
jgi:phosphoribosyl 1,2-cyclic phosphodiesterase